MDTPSFVRLIDKQRSVILVNTNEISKATPKDITVGSQVICGTLILMRDGHEFETLSGFDKLCNILNSIGVNIGAVRAAASAETYTGEQTQQTYASDAEFDRILGNAPQQQYRNTGGNLDLTSY